MKVYVGVTKVCYEVSEDRTAPSICSVTETALSRWDKGVLLVDSNVRRRTGLSVALKKERERSSETPAHLFTAGGKNHQMTIKTFIHRHLTATSADVVLFN